MTGDSLTGNCQAHDKFLLLKVFCACHSCFMREFVFSVNIDEMTIRENGSKINMAKRLVSAVDLFYKFWLV